MMRPSWMPSVGDIIFILLLQLIFVFIPNFIFADGSTGWHLVTGQYVLEHWQIPRTDLISYTFPDKPWVAYEWLFDTVIALLDKIAGLKLVAVASCSAIAWLFLLLYGDCRRRACHFFPAMVLCVMGALISAIHWLARPHLVTFFGVYFFCRYLQEFRENKIGSKKLMLILGLCMLIWVNSHPAFLMGMVILGIYLFADLAVFLFSAASEEKNLGFARVKSLSLCLLLVVAVSFINPYGLELYKYIIEYLHQTGVLAQTDEYGSPVFHGQLQSVLLEFFYLAFIVGCLASAKKPSLGEFLTVLAYAHLSLASKRNMPLFIIVSLPLIAELIGSLKFSVFAPGSEPVAWLETLKKRWDGIAETMDTMEFSCTRHALPIAAILILCVSCFKDGKALGLELVRSKFDPKSKPTETLRCLEEKKLDPSHGFTFDNWGGYIRYKTGMRVFIDDRVDFYGQKFYFEYADVATGQSNWRDVLNQHKIDWILFPNNSVLVTHLKQDPDWKLLCEDQASCLYLRNAVK